MAGSTIGSVPADPAPPATRPGLAWLLYPGPAAMRRIAGAGVIANAGIIMTGAAVRLSQSGLGCPDWPACTAHSIGATGATGQTLVHRWIEFGNRRRSR